MQDAALSRMRSLRRRAVLGTRAFIAEWSRLRVGGLAAEIAFFGVLGIFPTVIVFASALGSLDSFIGVAAAADIKHWVLEAITETFGTDNSLRGTAEELFDQPNAGLLTLGLGLTALAASRSFTGVVNALNAMQGTERRRNWFSTRFMAMVMTLYTIIVGAVVAMMVVVGPLFGNGAELADRFGAGPLFAASWELLRWPVAFAMVVVWASSVYHLAPRRRTPWRSELPGAVTATLWWLAVSNIFRVYLDAASQGVNAVFGLLGGALSLLVWLYLLSLGLLVGAHLNHVVQMLSADSCDDARSPPCPPDRAAAADAVDPSDTPMAAASSPSTPSDQR